MNSIGPKVYQKECVNLDIFYFSINQFFVLAIFQILKTYAVKICYNVPDGNLKIGTLYQKFVKLNTFAYFPCLGRLTTAQMLL